MRAVQWHARKDVRMVEVPDLGAPPPGWVRLRVEACGICGTDLEEYLRGPIVVPLTSHPTSGAEAPLTLGHEAVGVVVEAAPDADLVPGQRVAVEGHLFCGACRWCQRGQYPLCASLATLGQTAHGGLAEEMLAPAYMCLPYGDELSAEEAAFAEPLSVAVRAARRAGIVPGSTLAVVGAGTIGLLAIQVARLTGAEQIMAVEHSENRRRLAKSCGADLAVDPTAAADAVGEATNGVGFDIVIEAAGTRDSVRNAVRWTRKGGRTAVLGVFDGQVNIDLMDLLLGEKEIVASLSHTYDVDFPEALGLLERGAIDVKPMITDRIGLDEVVTHGFEALCEAPDAHLKVMVFPQSPSQPAGREQFAVAAPRPAEGSSERRSKP